MTPVRTVFLGTGEFAVPIVGALHGHPAVRLVAVVTGPTRTGSRGRPTDPPVAAWATSHGMATLRPEILRAPDAIAKLADFAPDLLVLADYGQLVPQRVLDLPRHGALNIHPSLLPRHRGATPIPSTILAGDPDAGVTLMLMDAGMDTGPLIAQRSIPLSGSETAPQLEVALSELGAELLAGNLPAWLAGEISAQPQDAERATLTRPLQRDDGRLDPSRDAAYLERQVRAFQPWPGTFFEAGGSRYTVWRAAVVAGGAEPGVIVEHDKNPAVATADGFLTLLEVQPAGGRRMSGAELLRGRPSLTGQSVE